MGRLRVRLASRNENKLRELERLLGDWQLGLLDAENYPPETGATYYENALGKARHGAKLVDEGAWVLGEDSGLEVDGLGGGPGVRSARFGGGEPVERLLAELRDDEEGRRARYVCELVAISPTGEELRGTGVLEGRIAGEPRGDEGFGYDPIFIPAGEERTVAELGNEWKAENSHRARAARDLLRAMSRRGWSGV